MTSSPILSRHTSNGRRKRRKHSSKHFKPRHRSKIKRYSIIKILEVEGVAVEVVEMVAVVKATIMKGTIRRRNIPANQICVEEDVLEEEATDQITPTSSATNVTNMATMHWIATLTNVIIMVKWGILHKIVKLYKDRRNNQPSLGRRNK